MRLKLLLMLSLISVHVHAGQFTITITEAQSKTSTTDESFYFIESNNPEIQNQLRQELALVHKERVYSQRDPVTNAPAGPVMVKSQNKVMTREKAGRDIGIGAAMCLGGCLFILVAGDQTTDHMGNTNYSVEGPLACLPGSLWLGGALFMGKGIIELVLPRSDAYYGVKSYEEIIEDEKMVITNRISIDFEEDESDQVKNRVLRMCLAY